MLIMCWEEVCYKVLVYKIKTLTNQNFQFSVSSIFWKKIVNKGALWIFAITCKV